MPDATVKRRKTSSGKAEVRKSNEKTVHKEPSSSPSPSGSESDSEEQADTTPEQTTSGNREDGADEPKKTFKDLVSIFYSEYGQTVRLTLCPGHRRFSLRSM